MNSARRVGICRAETGHSLRPRRMDCRHLPCKLGHVPSAADPMTRLISAYQPRLRRMAEEAPPSRRMNAMYAACLPWVLLILVASLAAQALGTSRQVEMIILLPLAALAAAGACYAGSRVVAYGWQFDRTPPAAPWAETSNGSLLVHALRRVTLNRLSGVTLQTRLKRDLKLTGEDTSVRRARTAARGRRRPNYRSPARCDERAK